MTSTPTSRRTRSFAGLAAAATLLLAACSGSDDAADTDVAAVDQADVADNEQTGTDPVDADPAAMVETSPVAITGESLPEYGDPENDPAVGTPSPVLSGVSFDGSPVTIGESTDQPTLVVFLAHWCPACNEEIPELVGLAEAGELPEGIDVVAVSTAVAEDRENYPPSGWFDDQGWAFPVMADSAESAALTAVGGNSFPFAVVLDTDGSVLARKAGQSTADVTVEFLEAALATADA